MATIYEIRRANLRRYIDESPMTAVAIAHLLGLKSGSHLSQLTGKNPTRELREDKAREYEKILNLDTGWFDVERDDFGKPLAAAPGNMTESQAAEDRRVAERRAPSDVFRLSDNPARVAQIAAMATESAVRAGISVNSAKFAALISLSIEAIRLDDTDDHIRAYIDRLVGLAKADRSPQ